MDKQEIEERASLAYEKTKLLELKQAIGNNKLAEAHHLILELMKNSYFGCRVIDLFAMRYFVQASDDGTTTELEKLVEQYLEKTELNSIGGRPEIQRTPMILSRSQIGNLQRIYERLKLKTPTMTKDEFLDYIQRNLV